jgi:hypothetical protein
MHLPVYSREKEPVVPIVYVIERALEPVSAL